MDDRAENSPRKVIINSDNFIWYLTGGQVTSSGDLFSGNKEDFAKSIDVGPIISGAISDIYATPKFNESEHTQLEQARIVYFDMDTDQVRVTAPEYGTTDAVNMGSLRREVIADHNFPLLEIHDHTNGGLFTPPDFISLIIGNSQTGVRFGQGIMILCGDLQVMGLATKETPLFDQSDKAVELVQAQMAEVKSILGQTINQGIANLEHKLSEKLFAEGEEYLFKKMSETVNGRLNAEAKKKLDDLIISSTNKLQETSDRVQVAKADALNKPHQVANSLLVSFANLMGVKLYSSTDRRNFKEFSA